MVETESYQLTTVGVERRLWSQIID